MFCVTDPSPVKLQNLHYSFCLLLTRFVLRIRLKKQHVVILVALEKTWVWKWRRKNVEYGIRLGGRRLNSQEIVT